MTTTTTTPAEASSLEQEIKRVQQLQKAHEERFIRFYFGFGYAGTVGHEVISGLQALRTKQDGKPLRWNIHGRNHQIPESKLQGLSPRQISALIYTKVSGWKPTHRDIFGRWFVVPTDPDRA